MAKTYHIYFWKRAPFLRLLIPFIAGLLLATYFSLTLLTIFYFCIGLASVYIIISRLPEAYRFYFRTVRGSLIFLFMVGLGMAVFHIRDIRQHKNWYGHVLNKQSYAMVTLLEPLQEKQKTYKAEAAVQCIFNGEKAFPSEGKVLLYFSKDSAAKDLEIGDTVIINSSLQEIRGSGNPGGFNYGLYLARKHIFHQAFLKDGEWYLVGKGKTLSFKKFMVGVHGRAENILKKYIHGDDELALAKALLTGYRLDLDKDLVQFYSNAGVVHLIAISGLHLGLIYILLLKITSIIPLLKRKKFFRFLLIIFGLWFFALFTGSTPSVLRAAIMFSFICMGTMLGRSSAVYNTVFASAFLLLCYDPMLLWQVGFQLSYLAVLGILILAKPVYHLFYVQNKILDYAWQLGSVSIAAQVFTIPVCLYYFHQIPLLFFFANIVAIPLTSVALWMGMLLLIFSFIQPIAWALGKLVSMFLWMMNHWVISINSLPIVVWDRIHISLGNTVLLYLIFLGVIYWLFYKNKIALFIGLAGLLLFAGNIYLYQWTSFRQDKLIVYNISGHRAIDFIQGNTFSFLGDSTITAGSEAFHYNIKPSRNLFRAAYKAPLATDAHFVSFKHRRIMLVDREVHFSKPASKVKVDYIIISHNAQVRIGELNNVFDCAMYIFDGSNSYYKIQNWKKECEELHLHSHSVSTQGAYIANF